MDSQYDLMVIGAGIAGLTLAYASARAGSRVAVFEASAHLGGCVHTARFPLGDGEYWVELGAHTLFNSYRHLLDLFPALRLDEQLQTRQRLPYRLWRDGATRSIVGALHWLDLARALPRTLTRERAGRQVGDYFSAIAGARNYTQVIGPALDGLLCQPAAEFPADLLFKSRERQRGYPRSFSLRRGMGVLGERLAAALEVQTERPVERITRDGGHFVCTVRGQPIVARQVALAVPAAEAARLLREIEPAIADKLELIAMARVESTAVVLAREDVKLRPLSGLVGRDSPFYSVVSRDVVPDDAWRGFTFHFRPGIAAAERLLIAASVLNVDPAVCVATAHTTHQLPALRLGHAARIEAIDDLLRRRPIAVAGNYFSGLSLEDCAARAQREAARLMADKP